MNEKALQKIIMENIIFSKPTINFQKLSLGEQTDLFSYLHDEDYAYLVENKIVSFSEKKIRVYGIVSMLLEEYDNFLNKPSSLEKMKGRKKCQKLF